MGRRSSSGKAKSQLGFTYLGVLLAVALLGASLTVVAEVWSTTAQRQKMAQLEWVGQQYLKAIESYYYSNTGSVNFYPKSLEDLLEDKRHLSVKRHMRQLYPNPLTGKPEWGLVNSAAGGIQGVTLNAADNELRGARSFVFRPVVLRD